VRRGAGGLITSRKGKSGRGLPQSKTLRDDGTGFGRCRDSWSVLEARRFRSAIVRRGYGVIGADVAPDGAQSEPGTASTTMAHLTVLLQRNRRWCKTIAHAGPRDGFSGLVSDFMSPRVGLGIIFGESL
jgi:hypothetical protein